MLALYPLLVIGVIVGSFLLLIVTDKLGWTSVYQKRKPGNSLIGGVLLGTEHVFAPEHRKAAIEYRIESKEHLRDQALGDDHDRAPDAGRPS